MNARLMSDEDLVRVTGKRRYTKQAEWFAAQFGISVSRAADGKLVMTWATFEALNAKKAGVAGVNASEPVVLCFD